MSKGILLLGLAGAGAFWAYKQGYLPQLSPVVEAGEQVFSKFLPQSEWDRPARETEEKAAAIREASGGQVVPILGPGEVVEVNRYEAMLRTHWRRVSGWARQNVGWAAAICKVENSGMNPRISGDNGTSHGVLQVKVATAETCYRAGYIDLPPTKETLLTYEGGIYFGTAEMERLAKMGKGLEWTLAAYNGGAGWEQMDAKYQRDRRAYVDKVRRAFVQLYGKGAMA